MHPSLLCESEISSKLIMITRVYMDDNNTRKCSIVSASQFRGGLALMLIGTAAKQLKTNM